MGSKENNDYDAQDVETEADEQGGGEVHEYLDWGKPLI